jgi:ketol-acid reductoisomerase
MASINMQASNFVFPLKVDGEDMRKTYFHDVLRALNDAGLSDKFHDYAEKNRLRGRNDYDRLYDIGMDRGMDVLFEQIKSGEFAREL